MKTQVKNWLRWGAAGAFGLMLTLNVMVSLDFEKDKLLPTLTLVELGNRVQAQSESGGIVQTVVWAVEMDVTVMFG